MYVMKNIVSTLIVLIALSTLSFSQGFTDINADLTGTHMGDIAWGDYDADGDLDIILTGLDNGGNGITSIYKNNGDGIFTELVDLNIPGTYIGDVIWGDYDADGDLDILIQGFTSGDQITKIYNNTGDDNFVDSDISFPAFADGSLSFVDYNNDGFVDVMLAGYDGNEYLSVLYKNNGDATFTEVAIQIPGAIKSSYEWADYDNDGDMDVFVTGLNANGVLISILYKNMGNDTFNETPDSFEGAWLGDAAWGDFDNDGDLDLLISGYTVSTERISTVYKNNGSEGFSELLLSGLVGVSHSSTIWGDYDNDGDLDIFIGGTYEGTGNWIRVTDVFINNGDGTFTAAGFSFTKDAYWGESSWGDYDNDGDLDLVCCGYDDLGGSNTIIYRNDVTASNTAPTVPENLISQVADNEVVLSWDASYDNETPSEGLSYNAYIKNEIGEIIWNSNSLSETGFIQIPCLGNAQQNTTWTINDLSLGTYTWSVQAIDHNYAGSEFSIEDDFIITYVDIKNNSHLNSSNELYNYPNPFISNTTFFMNITKSGFVEIDIYDTKGQLINSLVKRFYNVGDYSISWDGKSNSGYLLPSGLFSYIFKIDNLYISNGKCLLVR